MAAANATMLNNDIGQEQPQTVQSQAHSHLIKDQKVGFFSHQRVSPAASHLRQTVDRSQIIAGRHSSSPAGKETVGLPIYTANQHCNESKNFCETK